MEKVTIFGCLRFKPQSPSSSFVLNRAVRVIWLRNAVCDVIFLASMRHFFLLVVILVTSRQQTYS